MIAIVKSMIGLGVTVVLCILLATLRELLTACRHRHTSLPYNGRVTCTDCGMWRFQSWSDEPSAWQRPKVARITQNKEGL